jgi:hypothetical protein
MAVWIPACRYINDNPDTMVVPPIVQQLSCLKVSSLLQVDLHLQLFVSHIAALGYHTYFMFVLTR